MTISIKLNTCKQEVNGIKSFKEQIPLKEFLVSLWNVLMAIKLWSARKDLD